MKIITNSTYTHLDLIKKCAALSDELIIASPFLSSDIYKLLEMVDFNKTIKKITLLSVLESFDQSLSKPQILYNFKSYCDNNNILCCIKIDELLHSKIYIFKNNNKLIKAIVTSANFTSKGLCVNHETGISTNDINNIDEWENEIFCNSVEITKTEIETLIDAANNHKKKFPVSENPPKQFNPWDFLNTNKFKYNKFKFLDHDYYIKPVGTLDDPYKYNEPISTDLHFSRRKPHVKKGDIFICYAVGPQNLLGYYENISDEPLFSTKYERWPWYIKSNCLSPKYSNFYWEHDIFLYKAVEAFKVQYPNEELTNVGGFTLGALQWGQDKIKLSKHFAEYLISLIDIG